MKRREAIFLLGGRWSCCGASGYETTPMELNAQNINAFRQSLQDLGYVEGQNLIIAYRSAEGRGERQFPSADHSFDNTVLRRRLRPQTQ